jgi:ribosomal protein S27AE
MSKTLSAPGWIKQADEDPERERLLCKHCVPDSVMIKKLDDIEFLGPGNIRWICPRCGSLQDSTDQ